MLTCNIFIIQIILLVYGLYYASILAFSYNIIRSIVPKNQLYNIPNFTF